MNNTESIASTTPAPSDFLNLGFPNCSVFGETWHEMTAVTYLEALVAEGDTWQPLSPEQVVAALRKVTKPREGCALGSILGNHERMNAVAARLTSAEDARNFSPRWLRGA